MVEGAAFFLLCHDDVALDPDAVHKLVEESFRSNAGVVSPKFVQLGRPAGPAPRGDELRQDRRGGGSHHRGRGRPRAARRGARRLRRPGRLHPGAGRSLRRAQGIRRRHRRHGRGPRPLVAQPGGGLARRGGARTPGCATARRWPAGSSRSRWPASAEGRHPVTLQSLQRRHELRAVLKCYTRLHLLRVLPQAALLAFGEVVVAVLARDRDRARAVTGAWRWNLRRLTEISVLRGELAEHRLFPDAEVRRLQVRGSARLSRYFSRLSHQGLDAANAVAVTRSGPSGRRAGGRGRRPHGQRGVGLQRGRRLRRARRPGPARRAGPLRATGPVGAPEHRAPARRWPLVIAALVIALGTRELFFGTLPLVGQLAPLPSWSTSWHHFFSGWQSAGVGTTAPASPAFGLVGPERHRALRRHGHAAARPAPRLHPARRLGRVALPAAAGVAAGPRGGGHLLPRAPAALRRARAPAAGTGWSPTPLFPFIALRLARAAGVAPYAVEPGPHWRSRPVGPGRPSSAPSSPPPRRFAPAVVPMVLATAVAWVLGSLLVGRPRADVARARRGGRGGRRGPGPGAALGRRHRAGGQGVGGRSSASRSRAPPRPTGARSSASPSGRWPARPSPGSWWLGAALPLVIARGTRLAWAARLWVTGAGLVGARLRRPRRATSAPSRPRRPSCSPPPRSPSRPASASASPPSRTT